MRDFGRVEYTEHDRRIDKLTTELMGLSEEERQEIIGVVMLVHQICEEDSQEERASDRFALAEALMDVLYNQAYGKRSRLPNHPQQAADRDRRLRRFVTEMIEIPEGARDEVIRTTLWMQDVESFSCQEHTGVHRVRAAVEREEQDADGSEEASPRTLSQIQVIIERWTDAFRRTLVLKGSATAQLVPILVHVRDSGANPKTICSIVTEGVIAVALDVTMLAEEQCTVALKVGKPDLEHPLAGAECVVLGPEGQQRGNRGFTDKNGCWYLDEACRLSPEGDYTVRVSCRSSTTEVVLSFASAAPEGGSQP